jgi:hypothetical protein
VNEEERRRGGEEERRRGKRETLDAIHRMCSLTECVLPYNVFSRRMCSLVECGRL